MVKRMNRLQRKLPGNIQANRYATSHDFCRIFRDNLASLYLLSLLLTGDQSKAEHCFTAALEECRYAKQVFRDWAYVWAKAALARNAIAELQPRPGRVGSFLAASFAAGDSELLNQGAFELRSVLALPHFVRFVFVLSVLEQYSKHDCSLLLGCSFDEIQSAHIRALELIASAGQSAPRRDSIPQIFR